MAKISASTVIYRDDYRPVRIKAAHKKNEKRIGICGMGDYAASILPATHPTHGRC